MAITLKLSREGQETVQRARKIKGWAATASAWSDLAITSRSTLKRFLAGQSVNSDTFITLCNMINVNWQEVIEHTPTKETLEAKDTFSQSFMITGNFLTNQLTEIELVLFVHLKKLLDENCTITLDSDRNCLVVSGIVSEKQRTLVDVILIHLEKLLLECNITSSWQRLESFSTSLNLHDRDRTLNEPR